MQPKPYHNFNLTYRILVIESLPPFELEQIYTHPLRFTASNNPTEPAKEDRPQLIPHQMELSILPISSCRNPLRVPP